MINGLSLLCLGVVLGCMFPALAFMSAMAMVLIGTISFIVGRLIIAITPTKAYRPVFERSAASIAGYPVMGKSGNGPVTFRQFSDHLHQP
jgi:hypothetical protein